MPRRRRSPTRSVRYPRSSRQGGVDVDELEFHSRGSYSLRTNWKVAVENYLECYHCAVAHPGFTELIDVAPDSYRLERHPTFASHYAPPATAAPRVSST